MFYVQVCINPLHLIHLECELPQELLDLIHGRVISPMFSAGKV